MFHLRSLVSSCPPKSMKVLSLNQDSDQAILNFIAQLQATARQCNFKVTCACRKENDFTDSIILYKFVAGVM